MTVHRLRATSVEYDANTGGFVIDHEVIEPEFKPGDVVELNSGGPPMTIVGFVLGQPDVAICTWDGGTDQFKIATIKEYRR